jgi:DNA-binding CsgD family transcriptional regulator
MEDNVIVKSTKEKVIELRLQGKTYKEIKQQLKISKATISYHLNSVNLGTEIKAMTNDKIVSLNEYYKKHTTKECANKFSISEFTVKKYVMPKRVILTDEQRKILNYQRVKKYRQTVKEKLVEYKGGKCEKCSYKRCIAALDFHHKIPGEKDFGISQFRNLKWKTLLEEVDKCMLVCSNCHREIHNGFLEI